MVKIRVGTGEWGVLNYYDAVNSEVRPGY